jgi:hypothetical protein
VSATSRRLPGFGGASAPFLWRNLLDLRATASGDEICLDRPALDVLLAISGIAETRIGFFPGRTLQLRRRSR